MKNNKIDWITIILSVLAAVLFGLMALFVTTQFPLIGVEPQGIYVPGPPEKPTERPRMARPPTMIHVWPTFTPGTPTPIRYSNGEIDTLAAAVAYEALDQPIEGQVAVGCVIMRRAELAGKVFSEVLTEEFFGSEEGAEHIRAMKEWWKPDNNDISMDDWQNITVLSINLANHWIGCPFEATHYYSRCLIDEPNWAKEMDFLGEIGCHRFYVAPSTTP